MKENEIKAEHSLLLVDDDEVLMEVLARALTRRGYAVEKACNVALALEASKSNQFSKAVVDLKIAEESGLQLIPALIDINPSIHIVMLTGYSSIATAVEAMKRGAKNYLCKPANVDQILQAFESAEGAVAQRAEHDAMINPPSVERLEWEHIQKTMQENDNNISATARALGMHRRTLQRKLQKRPVKK
ncbi:MAG: response regulator transcription factor [Cellvibrionaceae bacterium]